MNDSTSAQKRRDIGIHAAVSAAVLIAVSGLIKRYGLDDRIYFNKGAISGLVFLLSYQLSKKAAVNFKQNRRAAIIACICSLLLTFTELLGYGLRLMENGVAVRLNVSGCLWMLLSACLLAWLLSPFFYCLLMLKAPGRAYHQDGKHLNRVFAVVWVIVLAGYLPCFLAFYPGLYCYDMIWQWGMFVSGSYNTHHPLLHTAISGGLLELGKSLFGTYNDGLALYALVQLVILSGSIAFAVRYMVKIGIARWICVTAVLFYTLFPLFPVLGVSTTKDIYFAALFLMVFVCICDMVHSKALYRCGGLVFFLVLVMLMGVFRNNAVYALCFTVACVLAVWLVLKLRQKNERFLLQIAVLLMVGVVGIQGLFVLLEKSFDADKGSVAEMLSVPCQQLARTYVYHGDEMASADKQELFQYIPETALREYKYYVSDPVKAELKADYLEAHKTEFFELWLRVGKQFPSEFVLAPLYNTMGVWYLGGDSSCYVEYNMSPLFDEEHVVWADSRLPGLKLFYSWFTDYNLQSALPLLSLVFYTPFYAWMVVIAIAVIVRKRMYRYLIGPVLLVGYMLTLLLGPCIIVRYMLAVMLCVPVLLGLVFCRGAEETL